MTFQATLERHLRAIQQRDLDSLHDTLSSECLVLITADGRLIKSTSEFLDMHREWFKNRTWFLEAEPVSVRETPEVGVAVLKLDYFDSPRDEPAVHETSYLTLIFARPNGHWEMIHDQNTPCKNPERAIAT